MMPMRKKLAQGKVNFDELAKMEKELDVPIEMSDFKAALKNISKSVSQENLEDYIDQLKEKQLDKLIIKTPMRDDCVVIRIDEYERIKNLYDKVVNQKC